MNNQELHDACRVYVEKGISLLEPYIANLGELRELHYNMKLKKEPYRTHDNLKFLNEEERMKDDLFIDKLVRYVIEAKEELLHSVPEYNHCTELMNKDETISKQINRYHRTFGAAQYITPWTYISHILSRSVSAYVSSSQIDSYPFERAYLDLEEFLYAESFPLAEIAPLHFFRLGGSVFSLELTNNLSIRKVNDEEKKYLVRTLSPLSFDLYRLPSVGYVIEYKLEIPKGFETDYDTQMKYYPSNLDSIFAAVISALRLFQNGSVGTSAFCQVGSLDLPLAVPFMTGLEHLGLETDPFGGTYVLEENQIEYFKKFWSDYHQLLTRILDFAVAENDKLQNIKVALNRFNYSHQSRSPEDRVLDRVISLEALFSKEGDPTDSITYKLALRSAKFVSQDSNDMKNVYCKLKKIYGLRSKIVHGSHYKPVEGFNLHDHVTKCLRLYLARLNSGQDHNSIIDSIDFG